MGIKKDAGNYNNDRADLLARGVEGLFRLRFLRYNSE
jgi:hypothetical protein